MNARRALRTVAAFEAFKGAGALAAGLAFVGLLHRDLHRQLLSLIAHAGLSPGGHYPALLLVAWLARRWLQQGRRPRPAGG